MGGFYDMQPASSIKLFKKKRKKSSGKKLCGKGDEPGLTWT